MLNVTNSILNYTPSKITIKHYTHQDHKNIDFNFPLFVIFSENPTKATWNKLPFGAILEQRWREENSKNAEQDKTGLNNLNTFNSQLPNDLGTPICLINLKKYDSTFKQLEILRKQFVNLTKNKPTIVNLCLNITNNSDIAYEEEILNKFILCAGSNYTMLPKISQKYDYNLNKDLTVLCHGVSQAYNYSRVIAEINGNGLTRYLCALPSNYLFPESYRIYVNELAEQYKWQYEFLDQEKLKQKKAGAFLAVAQGSAKKDAGIIHLRYQPKDLSNKKISLVGKGICFDTGGHNLKTPLGSMYGMQHDMTGSAVALGILAALTELQVPFQVDAYLALAQNDIGPDAYKPADVVFASNGMSIEVINTDAEGRMILADTLYLASCDEPNVIIDYATLTGSCVRALDQLYSGLVTNQPNWNCPLIDIGQNCGERVWPFPYTDDYDEVLKSDIADIKQCHEGSADQIRAARFLGKFVANNVPWIHLDLSAHIHKGGLAHINNDTTGFGVRFTLSCLLDSELII